MGEESSNNLVSLSFGQKYTISESDAEKLRSFRELIENEKVMVLMDGRHEAALLPPALKGSWNVALNFSHGFQIRDFSYNEAGVRASLSFPEGIFFCDISWPAVYGLHVQDAEKSAFFPGSAPQEAFDSPALSGASTHVRPGPGSHLSLVED